jgi:hypothetical protein
LNNTNYTTEGGRWARRFLTLGALVLFFAGSAGALDYGLAVSQEAKVSTENADGTGAAEGTGEPGFFYTPVLRPWASASLGEGLSLYLSGDISLEYEKTAWRAPVVLPELNRTELTWLVSPTLGFTLGRQYFQDLSGLAVSGLFDGLNGTFSAGGSRFSAGAYYSGLLYKKQADILMTGSDNQEYATPVSSEGGYFASRRVLTSFKWEKPDFKPSSSLSMGLLAQFDVNGNDDWLHSQYFSYRLIQHMPWGLSMERAFTLSMAEKQGEPFRVGIAGIVNFHWLTPGSLDDKLTLRAAYSSHAFNERLGPFTSISSIAQGQVFSPSIASLIILKLNYNLRPLQALSLNLEGSYFFRIDNSTFQDNWEPETLTGSGACLGGEFFLTALWMPLPDLALSFGGGAFLPRLGNSFTADAHVRWKTSLGLILSF